MCNMLDFMTIDTFLQPAINCLVTYSKDFRLLHGVLLGEVRRKHLEELFLDQRMTDFRLYQWIYVGTKICCTKKSRIVFAVQNI